MATTTYKIEVKRGASTGTLKFQHGSVSVNTACWWDLNNKIDAGSYTGNATWMPSKGGVRRGSPAPGKATSSVGQEFGLARA